MALRVALIGGTSHAGKSTTAQALAGRMGWESLSTDRMARHPGRPWTTATFALPDHVVRHYRTLSPQALCEAQLAHYRAMQPMILERIETQLADHAPPMVLEGSGVLPSTLAAFDGRPVRAVWLAAAPALIEARVRRESGYAAASPDAQALIDKFVARSQLYDAAVIGEARRLGLPVVEVVATTTADAALEACAAALGVS